jgi:hypothetical protein
MLLATLASIAFIFPITILNIIAWDLNRKLRKDEEPIEYDWSVIFSPYIQLHQKFIEFLNGKS